jgi:hypothetical protein
VRKIGVSATRKIFILLGLCVAGSAAASPVPRFLPDRDVAVTYQLTLPGRDPQTYLLSYDAADQLARIDSPAQHMFVLANLPSGQAQLVVPALHAVVDTPDFSGITRQIENAGGAQFTPLGHGHYAGLRCERYRIASHDGAAQACITPNGVVLQFDGHDRNGAAQVTALSVTFTPQPGEEFLAPANFANIHLSPGMLTALLQPR